MLGMLVLLKLMSNLAPTGIVNYTGMELVFERLGRKWPGLNGTSKSLKTWAGAMSQSLRIAMAHVRKLAQQPKRFDQRTKGLSPEEKQALKDLVAMHKKSEGNFVDNFESQDLENPPRRLRKVDTDEMDFQALCDDLGNGQRQKKKRRTLAKEGGIEVHVQATLKASLLIEAMSADPVSPALKTTMKRPAGAVFKKPAKAQEEDYDDNEEEEEEEAEAEEEEEAEVEEEEEEEAGEVEQEQEQEQVQEITGTGRGRGCASQDNTHTHTHRLRKTYSNKEIKEGKNKSSMIKGDLK
jgi:hypothetical protein